MVEIGKPIPDFELDAFYDKEIKKIRLSQYKGNWLVIFFYPADFTFVCPTELEELADNYHEFKRLKTEILSVSADTAYVHKAWHDSSPSIKKIRFPMVADPSGKVCREFGVYIEDAGMSLRGTFIIDPKGVLKAYEVNDNTIGRNAKELLRKLEAAKFVDEHEGYVCPASWAPGKDALKTSTELIGKL